MKKLLLFLPVILLFSCTVQKRKYQKGFYVNWNNHKTRQEAPVTKAEKPVPPKQNNTNVLQSLNDVDNALPEHAAKTLKFSDPGKTAFSLRADGDSCDVLVFKDGSEIKGKVMEVGLNEIKYKRCDTPDGPMYISKKSELFMIKYANGTREVVKSEAQPERQVQTTVQKPNVAKQRNYARQVAPLSIAALVFGILAIVTAYFGLLSLIWLIAGGGWLFLISFVAAIIAVVSGFTSKRQIKENPGLFKGKALSITGTIMGMVMLGIYLMAIFITLRLLSLI